MYTPPLELAMSPARLVYEQLRIKAREMGNEGKEDIEEERRKQQTNLRCFLGMMSHHLI